MEAEPTRNVRLDLYVKYLCGCTECNRADAPVSVSLLKDRTEENDRKIINYLMENFDFRGWHCHNRRHRSTTMTGFSKILAIMN